MADAGDKSISGYANPKCYAKAVCECSAKVDDEHYVSENALEKITQPEGYIVSVGGSKSNPWLGPITRVFLVRSVAQHFVDPKLPFYIADVNAEDLEVLAGWVREGKLPQPGWWPEAAGT